MRHFTQARLLKAAKAESLQKACRILDADRNTLKKYFRLNQIELPNWRKLNDERRKIWTSDKAQALYQKYLQPNATYRSVGRKHKLSGERIRQIFAEHHLPAKHSELDIDSVRDAASLTTAARQLDVTPRTLVSAFKKKGLSPPKFRGVIATIKPELRDDLIRRYQNKEFGARKIAEILGTSLGTALRFLKINKIPRNPTGWTLAKFRLRLQKEANQVI